MENKYELNYHSTDSIWICIAVILSIALAYSAFRYAYVFFRDRRKEPKYRVCSAIIHKREWWFIEEKHFFYYVPLHGVYPEKYEAQAKCYELNELEAKNK